MNEDSQKMADADQKSAMVADFFPPLWWRMYTNLLTEGFTKKQAMRVLLTFISESLRNNP